MKIDKGGIEASCWSLDFDYEEYLKLFSKIANNKSVKLTEQQYKEFVETVDDIYYKEMEKL